MMSAPPATAVLLLLALAAGSAAGAAVPVRVLDTDGKPVPEAVVFVYDVPGKKFPPPAAPYIVDQVDKEFVPHLRPILAGGRVRFPNKDNIHHHLYSFSSAKTFELPLYKGELTNPVTFAKTGVVKLGCNIHDWMSGVILVLQNPYFAVTDAQGAARLDQPPGGPVEVAVFHERLKGPVDATRRALRAGAKPPAPWTLALKPLIKKARPAVEY